MTTTLGRLRFLLANGGAQLGNNFLRSLDGRGVLVHIERNRTHTGVAASAVTFADSRQIYFRLLRSPRIRAHGNLHAKTALAQAHAVDRLGMQIIRDELVVAFE